MANRWAVISGNWSNTATWNNGGVLGVPTASDVAYANNQTIYIDTNITVQALSNAALAGTASVSGSFYLNNAITASTTNGTGLVSAVVNTPLVFISGSSNARINTTMGDTTGIRIRTLDSSTLTVSGSVFGGSTAFGYGILHTSTGTLYITGSVSQGNNVTQYGLFVSASAGPTFILGNIQANVTQAVLNNSISGSITVYGNVTAGGFSNAAAIISSTGGNITVFGNVTSATNVGIGHSGTGNIFVQGTVSALGGTNAGIAISNTSVGSVTVIGNVIGSAVGGLPTAGISNTSTGIVTVTGSIIANNAAGISTAGNTFVSGSIYAGLGASGIISSANRIFQFIGPVYSSVSAPGVQLTGTAATCSFTGPFYNVNNRNAVFAQNIQLISGSTPTWTFDTETYGGTKILYTSGAVAGYPSASNVRSGTVYGDANQFTGTVAIPAASNVIRGALVDATTGSASFTTQNVWAYATASMTASNSIGNRLRNTATVASDAALITSKGTI
jgi:hypothetical protein